MIGHLQGKVAHRDASRVVVDVGGVGYVVYVGSSDRIPARGQQVRLFTSLQVREDSMTLYGFVDRTSLELFELLLSSSGVGPKLALAALTTHPADVLTTAIAGGDIDTLTAVPGVGRKVAERLVLELKERVAPAPRVPSVAPASSRVVDEVRDGLLGLGYSSAEVTDALGALDDQDGDSSELLRRALLHLGARSGAR